MNLSLAIKLADYQQKKQCQQGIVHFSLLLACYEMTLVFATF
jgi:hypothetical protein